MGSSVMLNRFHASWRSDYYSSARMKNENLHDLTVTSNIQFQREKGQPLFIECLSTKTSANFDECVEIISRMTDRVTEVSDKKFGLLRIINTTDGSRLTLIIKYEVLKKYGVETQNCKYPHITQDLTYEIRIC